MKVTIIGAGNMGGAIARGLAQGNIVATSDITVSDPTTEKLEELKAEYPDINVIADNAEAIEGSDIIILAVKPWLVNQVLCIIKLRLFVGNVRHCANQFHGIPSIKIVPYQKAATEAAAHNSF